VDLTKPGSEPHDLELSVAQTAAVTTADLVVYEKGLQAAVDAAVDQTDGVPTVDAGSVAGLEPISHDGHDDADHDSPAGEEPSDLGDLDPHFWQDPLRLAKVVDAVAAALVKADPEHADDFRANAADLDDELTALDQEYAAGLLGCTRNTIVVSHNAFGYLGRYGLFIEPISGLSPEAEPTPADLARLQQLIQEDGITTVFGERLVSPKLAQSLADDMGVSTRILDPIEGLSSETADDDYLSLMRDNLAALREANGCP
jgi:zinc transport system substrate-binding protein